MLASKPEESMNREPESRGQVVQFGDRRRNDGLTKRKQTANALLLSSWIEVVGLTFLECRAILGAALKPRSNESYSRETRACQPQQVKGFVRARACRLPAAISRIRSTIPTRRKCHTMDILKRHVTLLNYGRQTLRIRCERGTSNANAWPRVRSLSVFERISALSSTLRTSLLGALVS
jgi:hypothetical protein